MKVVEKKTKGSVWVLVYSKPNEEKKASENLERQGFQTFLPLISPTNKINGSKSLVPVFPRYFFAKINLELDNWTVIKSSYGVSHIVMFSDKFTFIPNNIITMIKDKLDESDIYREDVSIVNYKKGDPVFIKEGRFAGIDAIFLSKRSKDRVRLLLKILNTSVVAEISKTNIENKEVVKNFKL